MYSYASKIQCLHGERSSSHLRPHLLSSHTHLSIPQRQPLLLIAWLSLQKVLWMHAEATTNVYAFIHIFSLFYTKRGTLHSSFHTFAKVSRRAVLSVWTGIFVGGRGQKNWELDCTVQWRARGAKTRNGIQFCWLSILNPSHCMALSPGSAFCPCKWVLLKYWQASRKQFVLLSGLKSPLAIFHTPLTCLVNLFLIDHAKVNFEPSAL